MAFALVPVLLAVLAPATVVLDPGHTPDKPGAVSGRGVPEVVFNDRLAAAVAGKLRQVPDVRVVLTRKPGETIGWPERLARIRRAKPALVVSIHHDSVQPQFLRVWRHDGKRRRYCDRFSGFSLFVPTRGPGAAGARRAAELLSDGLRGAGHRFTRHHAMRIKGESRRWVDRKRGIHAGDFLLLARRVRPPMVLLEAGVLVHRAEEQLLSRPEKIDAMASAIAEAIRRFVQADPKKGEPLNPPRDSESGATGATVTVVYDNYPHPGCQDCQTGWGFACVIGGLPRTILFDTGADAPTLLANMDRLGIDPTGIDVVVLSHFHGDHTGGLGGFLERNDRVTVYVLSDYPADFRQAIAARTAGVETADTPTEICAGAHTLGRMGSSIPEQSLVLRTPGGLVVITGCAHPGIVEIVAQAKKTFGGEVRAVLGGFHLKGESAAGIHTVIEGLDKLGVQRAGPCHCSGEQARKLFAEEFGDRYLEVGIGWKSKDALPAAP